MIFFSESGFEYLSSVGGFNRIRKSFRGSMETISDDGKTTYLITEEPNPVFYWLDFRRSDYGRLRATKMNPGNHKRKPGERSFVR